MLQTIMAAIFVSALFGTKPIAKVVGKVAEAISAKEKDKAARKAAMERYLNSQILDIEH